MKTWKTAGAYVQGTGHEKNGRPCQDRIYSIVDKNVAVISLADGAGSCSYSHIGAEIVTKTVCRVLKDKFDFIYGFSEGFRKDYILYELLMSLGYMACNLGVALTELSATLLFVAVRGNLFIAGHIGDGVIGFLDNEAVEVLSYPDRGEFANETYFVTSHSALDHFRIMKGEIGTIKGFILMSDGSSDSLYDKQGKSLSLASMQMLKWMDRHEAHIVKKALYKNLKSVFKKYTADDCSINLMKLVKTDDGDLEEGQQQFGFAFS